MYNKGETYICSSEVRDAAGALVDPTTITCTVNKPDSTQAATGSMTKDSVGKYHYDYNLPSDTAAGIWKAKVVAVTGTRTVISELPFAVEFQVIP